MDRNIVYPGAIPLDTDLLVANRNAMVAFGALIGATLGTAPVVDGLVVSPTSPASMAVTVAAGSITQLSVVDAVAFGSMAGDATPLMKMGINTAPVSFTLAAPVTAGQSVLYLIQAVFGENDDAATVLPYFNAANPAVPYLGPNNTGSGQVTRRRQSVQLQLKVGAAAVTGTQVAPPVDAGWVGLATVLVSAGMSAVAAANIVALAAGAPLAFKLPGLRPGFAAIAGFAASGSFVVPGGVTRAKVTVIGGGGAGGTHGSQPAGGGGAGGQAVKVVSGLVPGSTVAVTVAAGGAVAGSPGNGGNGGTSSFGGFASATGGIGGGGGSSTAVCAGGGGGAGVGGDVNFGGAFGTDANNPAGRGGDGGGAGAGRGSTGTISPPAALGYGGGGGGAGPGAVGAAGFGGIVIIEY